MYKKIMVPLDGSELAECVLHHVDAFVKGCNVTDVTFVRIVEPEAVHSYHAGAPIDHEVLAKRESAGQATAKEYLSQVRDRVKYENTTFHLVVISGRVAESLAEHAEKNDIDLILIATHGRSGVTRWVRGSVADKILRSASIPVLMVRAPGTKGGI